MKAVILSLLIVFIGAVMAQTNQTAPPPLGPSADVFTAFVLPDHPNKVITAGDIVEVLLGFVNNGEREFNITSISASLNHPLDYRYFIQNYTRAEYGLLVQPKEQVSVAYRFRPDPLLEPRDFGLVVNVFYDDESGVPYTNAFFNGTITIVEADSGFDLQQFIGVLGLVGYFALQSFGGPSAKKERPYNTRSSSSSALRKQLSKEGSLNSPSQLQLDDDWLSGTNVSRGSPASAKRRSSTPKN